jgi:hypothetical protein
VVDAGEYGGCDCADHLFWAALAAQSVLVVNGSRDTPFWGSARFTLSYRDPCVDPKICGPLKCNIPH